MKPKVLHIGKYHFSYKGGTERVLLDLCLLTGKSFNNFFILADDLKKTTAERINRSGVVRCKRFFTFCSQPVIVGISAIIKKICPDVIIFHLPNPLICFYAFFLRVPSKFAVFYHSDINRRDFLLLPLSVFFQDQLLKRSTKIIVSNSGLVSSSKYLSAYKSKCVVIPFGIDPERLSVPDGKTIKAFSDKYMSPRVLYVGRLVFYKGIEYLIKAMNDVQATLLLVGSGPLQNELKNLTKSLQLESKVFFLNEQTDSELAVCFQSSDIVVLPSITSTEAFGIVLLEAMACGKPVISTELGTGTSIVNQDGITGFVVQPCDPKILAEKINLLINDPQLRKQMGDRGRQRVIEYFNCKKFADGFKDAIDSLLKNKN